MWNGGLLSYATVFYVNKSISVQVCMSLWFLKTSRWERQAARWRQMIETSEKMPNRPTTLSKEMAKACLRSIVTDAQTQEGILRLKKVWHGKWQVQQKKASVSHTKRFKCKPLHYVGVGGVIDILLPAAKLISERIPIILDIHRLSD